MVSCLHHDGAGVTGVLPYRNDVDRGGLKPLYRGFRGLVLVLSGVDSAVEAPGFPGPYFRDYLFKIHGLSYLRLSSLNS